ncbi:hypothetical protein L1285_06710 [Pseudoalteromonas sp. DL2-H2.2]|uniref:DUF7822 domain-containing protein n=1 Tax=Pseudoalteromonas sp. DL2-H2.2 TaxID=2908889 RepID=UPI001F2DF46B|nr:hypothetical protein [Pseudoalteromonas sp. DL2-H2.2]MCF2908017.1 hypothetical protein [Pseudoalteromonas sp. DL2-H2.2]
MANRSYLFSANQKPKRADSLILRGLSEWNYDIPLIYKILVSGEGIESVDSLIWDFDTPFAISMEYRHALDNLYQFKEIIEKHCSSDVLKYSIDFLSKQENSGEYFLLEPYEIYLLEESPLRSQHEELVRSLRNFDIVENAEKFIRENNHKNTNSLSSLFSSRKKAVRLIENGLVNSGFQEWSDILAYAPYPPPKSISKPSYYDNEVAVFELMDTQSYAWIKIIEINRVTKKVWLKENCGRREFVADLIDENTNVNGRLNFRFNMFPNNKEGLTHVFSLMVGFGDDQIWRLSSSALEEANGNMVLRGTSDIVDYKYVEMS